MENKITNLIFSVGLSVLIVALIWSLTNAVTFFCNVLDSYSWAVWLVVYVFCVIVVYRVLEDADKREEEDEDYE